MKIAEARWVAEEYVLPALREGAVLMRRLVVLTPVELLVRGFSFASSTSSARDFHVYAIVDAVCSPGDQAAGMAWVRSPRLIYDGGLAADQATMLRKWLESEGLPLVLGIRSPGDLADDIERRERRRLPNPQKEETRGYSLILANRDDAALSSSRSGSRSASTSWRSDSRSDYST